MANSQAARAGGGQPALLARLAFSPRRVSPSLVVVLALVPPVLAGLVTFGAPAALDLLIATAVGAVALGAARLARTRPALSPIVVAVTAVALVGPAAPLWAAAGVAALAAALEVGRARIPGPPLPLHSALFAYAVLFLSSRGMLAAYLAPGRSAHPFPEPIRLWHDYFGGASAPLDSVTLYVGNVAGPMFATSLLAVAIGAAWLWYAGRVDLVAVVGVAAGGVAAAVSQSWNPAYHLLSGPLLFAAAYAYADPRLLPGPPLLDGILGGAAAFAGIYARRFGVGVEGCLVALAALQVASTGVVALVRTFRGRARRGGEKAARVSLAPPAVLRRAEDVRGPFS